MNFLVWFLGLYVHVLYAKSPDTPLVTNGFSHPYRLDGFALISRGIRDTNVDYNINPEKSVRKRATTAAAIGLAAAQKLLIGLRKAATSSKNYRLYQKNGNAETALKDFQSVGPRVVTNTKNQKRKLYNVYRTGRRTDGVIVGTVGDRRLILLPQGDRASKFYPVLEIRTPTDAIHDRIVYKMDY